MYSLQIRHRGHGQIPRFCMQAKSTLLNAYNVNTNLRDAQTDDLLLWVIGHIRKESREYTADDLVSKEDENALLICLHKVRSAENQQPECLNKFLFAVHDCCL